MSLPLFITGTDTEVGKTYASVGLLHAFTQLGYQTLGIKPVASGSYFHNGTLVNEDALQLQQASSVKLAYQAINPFIFKDPIPPHIAAEKEKIALNVADIVTALAPAFAAPADIHIIEGAGGWHTPLNATETLADFAAYLQLPVVMVVGIRLGCINHALLTYEAIQHKNLKLYGWIANCINANYSEKKSTIATLKDRLPAPCLGSIPFGEKAQEGLWVEELMKQLG